VSGDWVEAGATLVTGEDATLVEAAGLLEKQLDELRLRLEAATPRDVVQANILREQIHHMDSQLEQSRRHLADLTLTAAKNGRFLISDAA
ncbi:hypothetical protein ACO1LX_19620, partial [Staphylococcus aureus]